jgi:hypothetical protein
LKRLAVAVDRGGAGRRNGHLDPPAGAQVFEHPRVHAGVRLLTCIPAAVARHPAREVLGLADVVAGLANAGRRPGVLLRASRV